MSDIKQKYFGVPIQKDITQASDGSLIIRGYFTSDNVDQTGDLITRKATEEALRLYRQWGNVRYMHQPKPVGKVTRSGEQDGLAWNEVEIKVIDPQAVFEVKNGLLTALSVGIYVDLNKVEMRGDTSIINEYLLSEISLVDHPANYDARLEVKTLDALSQLVAERGMADVAKNMQALLQKEINMDNEVNDIPVEQPVSDEELVAVLEEVKSPPCRQANEEEAACVERKVEEILAENPDMAQEQAVAMAISMCSEECAEAEKTGEEMVEELELAVPEEESPDVDNEQPEEMDNEVGQVIASLEELVAQLRVMLIEQLLPVLRAFVEAQTPAKSEEQVESEELLADKIADAANVPVKRKGAIAKDEPVSQENQLVEVANLRDALTKYFGTRLVR